ncbi:hypothetical protein MTP04_12520 [Lysinibacillus sp. PLM2]|nr:hypothetical protein MTP04_12520 [Lysinibacillus sp. PLM2]
MTSTSFNPIQIQQSNIAQTQSMTLKQGQVFHGTIKKLYPDQIAEVQVGNHKFVAKLETPLKAGDSHFFQVTTINPQAELKVVSGPMTSSMTMSQQINRLIESMDLPRTNEMVQLLSHFLKEQLPISKEQLVQAQNWLKMSDGMLMKDGLVAIQRMVELNMPFTKDVFQAALNGSKTSGMTLALETFTQQLQKDTSIDQQTKTMLLQQLDKISKPLEGEKGGLILARSIQLLMNDAEPVGDKLHALNLLKEAAILPKQAALSNWLQESFNETIARGQNGSLQNAGKIVQNLHNMTPENHVETMKQVKAWLQNQPLLNEHQKSELLNLVSRFESTPFSAKANEQFAKLFHENLIKSFSTSLTNQLFSHDLNGANPRGHLLSLLNPTTNEAMVLPQLPTLANESLNPKLQEIALQGERQIQSNIDGNAVQQSLKTIFKHLGISYEAILNRNDESLDNIGNQLKPQLVSLLHDGQASTQLKEAAELLLARMNGMQLLSGENGHQHQIVMQIPVQFLGKFTEATLQWNGRMKENGKIDSNYARVLFYLEMETLKETVIDMQVQNRIVTIHVYNNHEALQKTAEPLLEMLKKRLSEKDYYLSGVFIKPFEKNVPQNKIKNEKIEPTHSNGVDFRV